MGVNNNQTPAQEQKYVTDNKLGGEYVFDKDGKAAAAYKAPHTSYLVVIDPSGKVVVIPVSAAVRTSRPRSPRRFR